MSLGNGTCNKQHHDGSGHLGVQRTFDSIRQKYFCQLFKGFYQTRSLQKTRQLLQKTDIPPYSMIKLSLKLSGPHSKPLSNNKFIIAFVHWYSGCCGYNAVLDGSQPPEDLQPILHEEVEITVASLKKGKSGGAETIPAELVQAGGETMTDVLTEICNRIWRTGEWPTPWTQSLMITLPNKRAMMALGRSPEYHWNQII